MNRYRMASLLFAAAWLAALYAPRASAAECASLKNLQLAHSEITSASIVAAGSFAPPSTGAGPSAPGFYTQLPSFCRVAGVRHPTPDSNIGFEVWMPASGWNGKLIGVGNGAWAGSIPYGAMIAPLSGGYATAATDTGHQGSPFDASFAAGHPERLIDFGSRATHEMTVAAKEVVRAFYGKGSERSLFVSCSTGGRQGLMEAYRYPDDYDGISSMAPANPTVSLMVGSLWTSAATTKDPARSISPTLFAFVHKAAVARCDADDGVKDGIISAPKRCRFESSSLQCKHPGKSAGGDALCLTAPQVEALRAIYQGPKNPQTGALIFPGFERGSEGMISIQASVTAPIPAVLSYFRDLMFNDPQWDFRDFNYAEDVSRAQSLHSASVDVPPTGIGAYLRSGRKLLMSHGWSDPLIPPMASVQFYQALTANIGASEATNVRLFMIPGMGHCTGGDGPYVFDTIATIDKWVETGSAPERIVVRNPPGAPSRTRPICPHPSEAVYSGTGSTDDEKNFRCEVPGR